jgi:hypothetical protein
MATSKPVQNETAIDASSEKPILAWEAQEFTQYERNSHWYVFAGLTGGLLVVACLFLHQWLAAVVFVLATFVVMKHADDEPRTLTYSINKLGVQVGDRFLPYNELKAYWLIYNPPVRTLTLQSTSRLRPLVKIDLGEVDPLTVREAFRPYLPEQTKQTEDFLDKFSRFIRL